MTLTIDEHMIETQLDGVKKLADLGGSQNEYPNKYRQLREDLTLMGLKVTEVGGKHTVSKLV